MIYQHKECTLRFLRSECSVNVVNNAGPRWFYFMRKIGSGIFYDKSGNGKWLVKRLHCSNFQFTKYLIKRCSFMLQHMEKLFYFYACKAFVQNKGRLLFHIYFFSYAVLTISRIVTYNSVFYLNHFLIKNFFFAHNFYTTTKPKLTTD